MQKTVIVTVCNQCGKEDKEDAPYICLPKGDLDLPGIWFGDIKKHLWFENQHFCSLNCFLEYIKAWHKKEEGETK